jgi:hypothetical protein
MNISFDKFEQFEAPILTLCNPNSEATIKDGKVTLSNTLGMLPDCKKVVLSPNFNTQWELSFEFSDNKNEQLHYMYKRLEKGRYIYVSDVGYFMIDDYTRHESDERIYKEISCHSVDKETERNECPLLNEGSYYFYTKDNQEGIIQKQMTILPKWKLGFVSDDLKDKIAYFDGENKSNNAYEFLWEEIEEAYECIIDVDFITRTLSFYSLEYYAAHHKTDIHLSKSNDLKEVTIESKDDDCFTAITVKQNDNLSLVYSNPNGSETLYNFTHCFSNMSSELQTALIKWQEKYEATILPYRTLSEQWATALDDLSNAEKDLDILKEELKNLERDRDTVINTTATDDNKQTALTTVNSNITAKQQAISAQENIVATKKANIQTTYETPLQNYAKECSLELTAVDINGSQIFTQELLNELSAYINPAEYSDEYITQTDDMKYAEIYQQSNKLFDRAKKELEKLSTQSYTFSVENNSFLFNKKFERFSKQLMPGAIVYLETSDDHMEQVHLTNFSIDYDDCSVSFTFGNKYDENDIKSLFDDVFGSVKTSAAAVKYLKNIVNDQRSELDKQRDWIDNALTLTKNHFLTSNNQSVIIDDSGYWGRRQSTDADGNLIFDTKGSPIYDNEQLRIVNNTLAITKDNWQSIATAIGKIYLYHDDATGKDIFKYGVAGDLIVGKLFLGKELTLLGNARGDGTYAITLNENGLTIINDGTTAGITIKDANGNKQFYADSDGNLCVSANITATSGSIGGWTIDINKIYSNDGNTYVASSGNYAFYSKGQNGEFRVGFYGDMYCSSANIAGTITAKSGVIGGWTIGGTYLMCKKDDNNYVWLHQPSDWTDMSGGKGDVLIVKNGGTYPFCLYANGNFTATKANITGTITANAGSIGGWKIADGRIYNKNSTTGYTFSLWNPGIAGGTIICCDKDGAASFYVNRDGYLHASSADITGTIKSSSVLSDGVIIGTGGSCKIYAYNSGHGNTGCTFKYSDSGYIRIGKDSSGENVWMYSGSYITLNTVRGYLKGSWYNNSGASVTSDRRLKNSIMTLTDNYSVLFDNLKPCVYKYNDGTSGRKHIGFIAQDVEDAIQKAGLTSLDAALVMDFPDGSGDAIKTLRYEEIIGMLVREVQILKSKVAALS